MKPISDMDYKYSAASDETTDRVKVLYIMGMTRSGSTILDRIIGQCDGYFSLGEAYSIWDLNVLQNQRCGCGSPFNKCLVWKHIFDCAYHGIHHDMAKQMILTWNSHLRTRHIPSMFVPYSSKDRTHRLIQFEQNMEKLYRAIRSVAKAKVVIDSSKFPTYVHLLSKARGIELYVVHIVRNPRAVAYSWSRRKNEPSTGNAESVMGRMTPAGTAKLWNMWNIAGELAFRDKKLLTC